MDALDLNLNPRYHLNAKYFNGNLYICVQYFPHGFSTQDIGETGKGPLPVLRNLSELARMGVLKILRTLRRTCKP